MIRTGAVVLALAGLLTAATTAEAGGVADAACPSAKVPALFLPRLKRAIAENHVAAIVAFGSSSTAGWHAADIAHAYPAILQRALSAAIPSSHVAVLNRGIGGQDVLEMVPRIDADVLAAQPVLVIWQLGANGAMRNIPPDMFRNNLLAGVRRIQAAGVDVVLMDNQRAPMVEASPARIRIAQALADVAAETGAGLFGRGALMDQWREAGHPYDEFVSDDGVHHNDHGYRCVAEALATSIIEGLAEPQTVSVSAYR